MLIFLDKINDTKYFVRCIHYRPELLAPELIAEGIMVESIPDPAAGPNQTYDLFFNPVDNSLWYEYIDIPLPSDEEQSPQ